MITNLTELAKKVDPEVVASKLLINHGSGEFKELELLSQKVAEYAKPHALYAEAAVEKVTAGSVKTNYGVFSSRILSERVREKAIIFPYIITVGEEVESLSDGISSDPLLMYCLEIIKTELLDNIFKQLQKHIEEAALSAAVSSIIPANDESWSICGLREIFGCFSPAVLKETSVKLQSSEVMYPFHSRSGVFIPSNKSTDVCEFCVSRNCTHCPNRKLPDGK